MNESQGELCLVGGKSLWFSLAQTKLTTGQNSAVSQRETRGVADKSGQGRGVPGAFSGFSHPLRAERRGLWQRCRVNPFGELAGDLRQPLQGFLLLALLLPQPCYAHRRPPLQGPHALAPSTGNGVGKRGLPPRALRQRASGAIPLEPRPLPGFVYRCPSLAKAEPERSAREHSPYLAPPGCAVQAVISRGRMRHVLRASPSTPRAVATQPSADHSRVR